MNCDWVKEKIFSYLDAEVTAEDREKIVAHLATCPACAEELACFKSIQQTAQTLEELKPSDYFELRLKQRLEAKPKATVWSFLWKRRLAWALTLPVLVILSFIVFRFPSSKSTPTVQVEADSYYLGTESGAANTHYVENKELENGVDEIIVIPVLSYVDQSY